VTACARAKLTLRRFSKVLLMPLLFCAYLLSARIFLWQVAAALFFGWLGDIFLIRKDDPRMMASGMCAFAIGHVCYFYAVYLHFYLLPPVWALIAVPLLFLCIAIGAFAYLKRDIPENLRALAFQYGLILCSVGAFAVLMLISGAHGGFPLAAGALLFLASDSILSMETFRLGDSAAADFAVMLTYIAAQALLIYAFAL
jgi:uncharacterized membrane protein YhhN